jgi:hypothetical protein
VGLAAGETCAFPQVITALPFQAAGTDFPTDYANDHSFAGGTNCGPADGAEAVFRIAMTAGQAIRIREMTAFDAVIRVLSACQDSAACLLSSDISEDVQFVAPATGDYFVVLESHSSTPSEVTWDFMISPTEPPQGLFEEFSTTNRNDLEGCSLTFTPNPTSQNRYGLVGTCACAPAWVVEPGTGTATTVLTLADSAASPYTFAHLPSFTFFGNSYSSMFVGSNGFVTFGSGDTGASSTVGSSGGFLSHPRIAGLDDDLNPAAGGIVTVDEFANRVVVTFDGVRFYGTTKVVSFQIVMDASGTITIVYLKIDDKADGYVGLSNGLSTGTLPSATNLLDVTPPPTNAGQLVLTEIHYNDSAASAEGNGEFIEIHNRSGFTLDLDCCVLSDTTGTFDIPAQTILDAGGYAVFVRSDVQADNGGIASGISYGNSIQLGNGNAEDITITCGGTVIDTVPFDAQPGWPAGANGASMQLAPIALTAAINDNPNVWCTSTSPYGSGDLGTPGAANEDCSTAFLSADFETDPSWSRAGDWAWGTPLSTYTGGPSACAGGTGCFGTNINGPYASNTDFNTNYVQSPPIDLSAVAYAVLTFDMWLVTEQSWDFARVELSTDGGATCTPVPMASPPYNGAGTHINKWHGSIATTWMPATGDLSAALGRSDVRLRWVLDADGSGARAGLYLDNVSVRGL